METVGRVEGSVMGGDDETGGDTAAMKWVAIRRRQIAAGQHGLVLRRDHCAAVANAAAPGWGSWSCWGGATTAAELVVAMVIMSSDMTIRNDSHVIIIIIGTCRATVVLLGVCVLCPVAPARTTHRRHARHKSGCHTLLEKQIAPHVQDMFSLVFR